MSAAVSAIANEVRSRAITGRATPYLALAHSTMAPHQAQIAHSVAGKVSHGLRLAEGKMAPHRAALCPHHVDKPNHSPSKPIDDPREVRLTKFRPYRFKDILRHGFEIDIRRRAFGAELFQDLANLAYRGIKILLSQFSRYRPYDALCQIRHFSSKAAFIGQSSMK
jgi:hypothetical protein